MQVKPKTERRSRVRANVMQLPERCPEKLITFLGHGNPNGPCWFIGMEEGIDERTLSLEDNIRVRLDNFDGIMDLHESLRLLGTGMIGPNVPRTQTWHWLAKILLALVERETELVGCSGCQT